LRHNLPLRPAIEISDKPRAGLHNPVTPAYKLSLIAALRH
jgi:hypothetical protein